MIDACTGTWMVLLQIDAAQLTMQSVNIVNIFGHRSPREPVYSYFAISLVMKFLVAGQASTKPAFENWMQHVPFPSMCSHSTLTPTKNEKKSKQNPFTIRHYLRRERVILKS